MQYSLTENGTYSQDIPTGTDAGAYTVWYRVIGDANHNDTAPASVPVSIGQKPLTITGVTAASKPYDGTTNAGITSVTFDGVTLNRGTDYTVTASFDDASVGNGKNITATVTLMEQAAKNYALEQSSFPTTGSITKAAAPGSGLHPAVTVINDLAKTYEMVLSNDYLPKLSSPCEYGNVSYSLRGTYLTDGYKDTVQVKVMEENGQYKLKLTVPAVDAHYRRRLWNRLWFCCAQKIIDCRKESQLYDCKTYFSKRTRLKHCHLFGSYLSFHCPPGYRILQLYRFSHSCNPVFSDDRYGRLERARRIR